MADSGLRDERCVCGNLVARVSRDGVEILCRRCKRIHRIPWPRATKESMDDRQDMHLKN